MTHIAAKEYVVRAHGLNEWVKVGDKLSVLWTTDPTKAGLFTKEAAERLALIYDGVAENAVTDWIVKDDSQSPSGSL